MDCSLSGSSAHGIFQARVLEWIAISFSSAWKWEGSHSVGSDSSRPHGLQPTRLLCPRDFPGKSTGVGCHCLLRSISYYPWIESPHLLQLCSLNKQVLLFQLWFKKKLTLILGRSSWSWKIESQGLLLFTFLWYGQLVCLTCCICVILQHSLWQFCEEWASLVAQTVKNLPARQETQVGFPGEENGNPVHYSCLVNSMDRGAWQATTHSVGKNPAWLSN